LAGIAVLSSHSRPRAASDQTALLDRTIAQGFALLTFPKELEDRFVEEGASKRFLVMLVAGICGILIFGGMIIADVLLSPETLAFAAIVHLAVFPPLVVAGLYILSKMRMPAVNEWLIAGAGILAVLLEAAVILSSQNPINGWRVVELNIIIVYTCAVARFWPAVTTGMAGLVVHGYIVSHMVDPTGLLALNTTLLALNCTAFVLYGNYKLEHDERMAFLLDSREKALSDELSEANERLKRMATTDMLTKGSNRRYFEEFLSECWSRAQEQKRAISLLVLDIDYFKAYNDRYGHQAGDQCLIKVAQALTSCIRKPSDLVARWGGEEFVVVLMDTDVDAAAAAAERIREAVIALKLEHAGSQCAPHVTVSGGRVSMRPERGESCQHMIDLADEALYRAKGAGRNRIYVGYERQACAVLA
jgi:diguanylate cyclase (GGDEF)-like protein